MNCCAPAAAATVTLQSTASDEIVMASRALGDGLRQTELSVPGMHCGGCIRSIEAALGVLPGVRAARVHLSTRRVTVRWDGDGKVPPLLETLSAIGYTAHLSDIDAEADDGTLRELVGALAVAGFAAMNIMLLSVSIWSGADPQTRDMFHWISALIALPTLAWSGRVFFRSAWSSLRHGRTNMDVPISIGVLLAFGLSLYETVHHGPHAYFDASVSLLFFLLIGRTLDHMMRDRARSAVTGLARLGARGALVRQPDGSAAYLPVGEIRPGMMILLAAGERIPVDGRVLEGRSDIDGSLVSGESMPQPVAAGAVVRAGMLNLTGPLTIVATAAAAESFLAEMIRMMEAAEAGRSAYRRISDRAAQLYAPVVHAAALLTFFGWMMVSGDIHRSIVIAIAVLIITCPCALGLAVPMVQVVAARRLFELGIMLKDGGALERLAKVDTVVFDKTGTLTVEVPALVRNGSVTPEALALAGSLARHSRHPYSRALAVHGDPGHSINPDGVSEQPGAGLEARVGDAIYRLGRPAWAMDAAMDADQSRSAPAATAVVLSRDGKFLAGFDFEERPRPHAREAVAALRADGMAVEVVSGDGEVPVRRIAALLDVPHRSQMLPRDKVARLAAIAASGGKTLMVGDGLNDAPALSAAHVSMAPASAADIGRNAADLVFLQTSLLAIPRAVAISRNARTLTRQNLWFAVGYNAIAVPLAVLGQVTPLIAAVAMSLSSLLVVVNALRLGGNGTAGAIGRSRTGSSMAMESAP
jgi:Cu2+-exporting ATPase